MAMLDASQKIFSAEMMLRYCEVENYLQCSKKSALKGFEVIQGMLFTGESAVICFAGFHNAKSLFNHDGDYSYIFTEKRLIYATKSMLKKDTCEMRLEDIKSVNIDVGVMSSSIIFDTEKGQFSVALDKNKTNKLYADIQEFLKDHVKQTDSQIQNVPGNIDAASEIKKFKDLLDAGAITQEEFDLKKKQLLGI